MAWAWQLLSSLTVSLSPWRTLSTNPQKKWFLAHWPSTSSQGQSRGGSSTAETGRDLWLPPVPPVCPSSRQQLRELRPCSAAWEEGPRVGEQRESQGLVVRKEHGTVCPGGSGLEGHSQVKRPGVGQSCGLPSGPGGSHRLLVSQTPGHRALLSRTWASCRRATWSLGAPWLSAGSGRHL